MFYDIFLLITNAISNASTWLTKIFTASDVSGFYFVAIFLCLLVRFIIQPVVGAATFTAASDRVREVKESHRNKGKFERNQKGRYSK